MDHSPYLTHATSFKKPTRPTHDETDSFLACPLPGPLRERADEIDQSHRSEDRRFGFPRAHHGDSEEARKFPDTRTLLRTGQPYPRHRRGPALDLRSIQKL